MKAPTKLIAAVIPLLSGLVIGLTGLSLTVHLVGAAPETNVAFQEDDTLDETLPTEVKDCQECHLDVTKHWSQSPHAHAFGNDTFQERWAGMGEPGECLVCHTTGYQQSTGEFAAEGIQCQACHGETTADHPPEPVPIKADTEYCGICHTTTLAEWRLTGHSTADIGCSDCHDPHSQQALFAEPDDLCLNCHAESLGEHAEDLHIAAGIGCIDCHGLVIPPDELPNDGIVPTGHSYTINATTCVACHTDTLHAGLTLPGYEDGPGAAAAHQVTLATDEALATDAAAERVLSPEQRLQTLEAALASRNLSVLFQGAVVGLVLGASTAWFISQNIRKESQEDDDDE